MELSDLLTDVGVLTEGDEGTVHLARSPSATAGGGDHGGHGVASHASLQGAMGSGVECRLLLPQPPSKVPPKMVFDSLRVNIDGRTPCTSRHTLTSPKRYPTSQVSSLRLIATLRINAPIAPSKSSARGLALLDLLSLVGNWNHVPISLAALNVRNLHHSSKEDFAAAAFRYYLRSIIVASFTVIFSLDLLLVR